MDPINNIAIIGLGYVGLPLAIEFAKHFPVLGFDINPERIAELSRGEDHTREANLSDLQSVIGAALPPDSDRGLRFSDNPGDLSGCNIYIITVPTPIDAYKSPDLGPLSTATATIGRLIGKGDYIIYESTVYPGCTEEVCVPILEKASGLRFNRDFFCGYSPERINPGDKINTLTKIIKVTSGSTPEAAARIDALYRTIITAGTHLAPSIKVAEAAKAIENAQRDVNISFVNELALIFDRIGIDTHDVLDAAATKWNFLKFKPGLVGGHCIGVDPYYLAHKAQSLGYHPAVILSGRRVNDNMGMFVANKVVKLMIRKGIQVNGARALILGITFKEDCPDIRNSRVVDIHRELCQFGLQVEVYDPYASVERVWQEYGIAMCEKPSYKYDAVILAVAHNTFLAIDLEELTNDQSIIYDTKSCLCRNLVDSRL